MPEDGSLLRLTAGEQANGINHQDCSSKYSLQTQSTVQLTDFDCFLGGLGNGAGTSGDHQGQQGLSKGL